MILLYYGFLNICGFLMMGIDKYKAIHKRYRISEFSLLCTMFLGGMVGSFLGMMCFHHKVRKMKFWVGIIISASLHIIFYYYLLT